MEKRIKISVVIPAYNAQNDIPVLAHALRNQTIGKENFEVILVDDGSTDKTAEIAQQEGFTVLSKENSGPARARNTGIIASNGDIVVLTDSDCVPHEDWLKSIVRPFEDETIVGVQGIYRTKQSSIVARFIQKEIEERYLRLRKRETIDFIGTYSAAYRKNALALVGMFDESFRIASGEDADLSYRMSRRGMKMILSEEAVVYHRHPSRLSDYFRQKRGRGYWRVRLYGKNPAKAVRDDYTPHYLKLQVLAFGFGSMGVFVSPILPMPGILLSIGGFGFVIASSIPSALRVIREDPVLAATVPWMHLVRSSALSLGLGHGMIAEGVGMIKRIWQSQKSKTDSQYMSFG